MKLLLGAVGFLAAGLAAAQDIRVEGGGGTLSPGVAEAAIQSAANDFQACYRDHAGRWVGGHVSLAVRVGTDGKKKRAWVDGSDLGSWEVEKCLVGVARGLGFGSAKGGEVTVNVPLDFQPSAEVAAMADAQQKDAAGKLRALLHCGAARSTDVTVYVGPGGKVLSVGFGRPPTDHWAECAAAKAKDLTLSDPRGSVAKATVSL